MTARTRKKLPMPPLACQIPACPQEYAPIGDYADTRRTAELGGWMYRIFGVIYIDRQRKRYIGDYLCPAHRDVLPWWPGRTVALPLPVRVAGSTRAEFLGVVTPPALPAPDALDDATRKLAALHDRQAAGEDVTAEVDQVVRDYHEAIEPDLEPLPPLPQRTPAGPSLSPASQAAIKQKFGPEVLAGLTVAGVTEPAWQAAINAELNEQALAGAVPLESLAPEPQEDEAQT